MSNRQQSLPGPDDITRITLPNGITVLVRTNFNSPSVVIGGHLACGSLFDTDEKSGLADFTASGLMRGTETRTFQQIFDALESVGAAMSFGAGAHNTGFSGRSLIEDLPLMLELLAEVLRHPVFPAEQIERLRAQFLTNLAQRAQDTAEMASITFDQIVFKGHPYARPEDGWPETVRAIQREDLADFHQSCFGPRRMVIALVGAIEPKNAIDQVIAVLGDWTNHYQIDLPALPPYKPLRKAVTRRYKIPGKSQADLVIGASGPYRKDPDFIADSLGNSALGQFGLGGRIGKVVREQSGLAYYASSSLNAGIGPGSWAVSAGVNPANVQKARDLICEEIARFVEKGITAEELADSQSNFIGRLPLSLESNSGVASALLNIERYDLGLDYYRRYPDMVRSVTPEQVLAAVRKYLDPERLAIAIAGP
ncbi:MAG: pitrilysin family protein [Anaerolineales bacterium]|jgi:zinc protease